MCNEQNKHLTDQSTSSDWAGVAGLIFISIHNYFTIQRGRYIIIFEELMANVAPESVFEAALAYISEVRASLVALFTVVVRAYPFPFFIT